MTLLPPVTSGLLQAVLNADAGPDLVDNVDEMRFPDGPNPLAPEQVQQQLAEVVALGPRLQLLFERLDPDDQELMVRVLAFRVLGHRKVLMPMATRLRELRATALAMRTKERTAPLTINGRYADDFDLRPLGYPLLLRAFVGAVVYTFEAEQYRYGGSSPVAVQPGDVVIDGGGYCGDTALYFGHLAGQRGRVISFEFEPGNLDLLRQNLELNPRLARRIKVIPAALWDRPDERLSFREQGPGTVIDDAGTGMTRTDTIDALVERGTVDRVDFIKMDIEGAELNALHGAEAVLRRFRPRLAIAAYHRGDDLVTLPEYLDGLNLGYQFGLRHWTMHGEETVLFAWSPESTPRPARPRRLADRIRRR